MCLTVIQNSAPEDAFLVRTLNIIKPAIPLDKAGYTLFYWRIRLITHSVFQCGGVGISIRYIAGLQREKVFLRSEERRVGKEGNCRRARCPAKKTENLR